MKSRAGFILFEVMLAVGIFAAGVIGLGYCVSNCLAAEAARTENERARLALENRMAEIEAGAVNIEQPKTDELKGKFAGMKLKQSRKPLKLQNEKKEPVDGVAQVDLEVSWESGGQPQAKTLSFYVLQMR